MDQGFQTKQQLLLQIFITIAKLYFVLEPALSFSWLTNSLSFYKVLEDSSSAAVPEVLMEQLEVSSFILIS